MNKQVIIGIDESGNSINHKNVIRQIRQGHFKQNRDKLSVVFVVIENKDVENIFMKRNEFKVNNNFFKKIHTHDLEKDILFKWIELVSELKFNFIYKTLNLAKFYEKYGWNTKDPYIFLIEKFFWKTNKFNWDYKFYIETRSQYYDLKTINYILDVSLKNNFITSKIEIMDKQTYNREYVYIELADTLLYLYSVNKNNYQVKNKLDKIEQKIILKILNKNIK